MTTTTISTITTTILPLHKINSQQEKQQQQQRYHQHALFPSNDTCNATAMTTIGLGTSTTTAAATTTQAPSNTMMAQFLAGLLRDNECTTAILVKDNAKVTWQEDSLFGRNNGGLNPANNNSSSNHSTSRWEGIVVEPAASNATASSSMSSSSAGASSHAAINASTTAGSSHNANASTVTIGGLPMSDLPASSASGSLSVHKRGANHHAILPFPVRQPSINSMISTDEMQFNYMDVDDDDGDDGDDDDDYDDDGKDEDATSATTSGSDDTVMEPIKDASSSSASSSASITTTTITKTATMTMLPMMADDAYVLPPSCPKRLPSMDSEIALYSDLMAIASKVHRANVDDKDSDTTIQPKRAAKNMQHAIALPTSPNPDRYHHHRLSVHTVCGKAPSCPQRLPSPAPIHPSKKFLHANKKHRSMLRRQRRSHKLSTSASTNGAVVP
mmetsp:Transcript_28007/g.78514  ORF Transcript_28007/g.78514 Transcript_28007/m.78514 type:complete len:444 (+) Transcript_28007:392-1723(+)